MRKTVHTFRLIWVLLPLVGGLLGSGCQKTIIYNNYYYYTDPVSFTVSYGQTGIRFPGSFISMAAIGFFDSIQTRHYTLTAFNGDNYQFQLTLYSDSLTPGIYNIGNKGSVSISHFNQNMGQMAWLQIEISDNQHQCITGNFNGLFYDLMNGGPVPVSGYFYKLPYHYE